MAAEERAKSEFTEILNSIERKYEIIDTKWTEEKFFEMKFRTQIPRDSEDFNALCDEWVDLFSEVTNTVWAKKISNTGPKIRFRKQYQCWTQGGKVVQKELLFDSRRCKGTLDIKVLTDNPFTRRKNKHIRLGLNVVVKINFMHLHQVDTTKPYAFFVHTCEPQPEPPKPIIQPNERLPQLVAEMVQKGLNASPKVVNPNPVTTELKQTGKEEQLFQTNLLEELGEKTMENEQHAVIQENIQLPSMQQQTIQLVQNLPIQGMETIKLELPPHLQQYTQFVVSDMSEPLLMCQSLMLDTSQVIPVSTHTLPSHFVQIHSQNLHNQ
ncbi:uncharacterized protein LOC103312268 [Tribolium castaneum]|uniref:Uncharacterized protein n=1 Tax=Tribolium castaneum TaxID=7070 RepID=A0A139WLD5_TRICA|nr:PREDICTED: uncharacterized protein LOC103312268 [Tribolium castaneum]KYB28868.1 hypothetical protein TcasGA2_TC032334 [Tribolium castaneum]|eukprot:XP_008190698.1 PREDICTED: uncharacterized protein LOC103312268 [Tribolium castaneum]